MTLEEDLHFKLQTLQDMFTSTRPVSVLYLRGEDLDDPDKHPVSLPGEQSPQTKTESVPRDGANWQLEGQAIRFYGDVTPEERAEKAELFLSALRAEASIMPRCTGKTDIHNLEPEDLRSISVVTARAKER